MFFSNMKQLVWLYYSLHGIQLSWVNVEWAGKKLWLHDKLSWLKVGLKRQLFVLKRKLWHRDDEPSYVDVDAEWGEIEFGGGEEVFTPWQWNGSQLGEKALGDEIEGTVLSWAVGNNAAVNRLRHTFLGEIKEAERVWFGHYTQTIIK